MKAKEMHILVRNFVIELIVYGVLVVAYSAIAFRLLGEPLARLFSSNLSAYALISLVLILTQGVILDLVTSFLLNRLHLERLE
jgi:hypothetical protein